MLPIRRVDLAAGRLQQSGSNRASESLTVAASGLVLFALPIYALGAAALFASPRPRGTSGRPHAFEPADLTSAPAITLSASLFASDWSRMSRPADLDPRCGVCGEPHGALIHRIEDTD